MKTFLLSLITALIITVVCFFLVQLILLIFLHICDFVTKLTQK